MICVINASEIQRPLVYINDDIGTPDFGKKVWGAVTFKAWIDPFDYCGHTYDSVKLHNPKRPDESWKFLNAKIGLMSQSDTEKDSFVVVYENCIRVKEEPEL